MGPDDGRSALTHRELEALVGPIGPKTVMVLVHDGRLFRREQDGSWSEYEPPRAEDS